VDGSTQLWIIKEVLEKNKSNYFQLFMDMDISLKFTKDKVRDIKELFHHLSLACYSSLKEVTHEGMSGTHDMRVEPLMTIPHRDYLGLQVYEDRFDTKGFACAFIFHFMDHDPLILAQGLDKEEVVEKIPYGPTNKEVYAPVDLGIEYRTYANKSLSHPSPVDISGVVDTMEHIG
jgi:hypothetical protein